MDDLELGTREWYSDLEWIAGYPTRNQVGATTKARVLHSGVYSRLFIYFHPFGSHSCIQVRPYGCIRKHIRAYTYITHELGAEALSGLAHAGLTMSESQVHKYTPESAYIVIVNTLGPRLLEKEALTA